MSNIGLDFLVHFSNVLVSLGDCDPHLLNLVLDFNALFLLVLILVPQNFKFAVQAVDHILLALKLCFEITLQQIHTIVLGFSSPFEIFNLGHYTGKVPVIKFVGFYLVPISLNNSISDALAHLLYLKSSLVFDLYLLVLLVLSLLSLLSMLLIVAELGSVVVTLF